MITHPFDPLKGQTLLVRFTQRVRRTLIADVTLLLEQDSYLVRIGVRWHTGAAEESWSSGADRAAPRRRPSRSCASTGPRTAMCRSRRCSTTPDCALGKNLAFTPRHVAGVRGIFQIFTPGRVAVKDGEISVKEAARLLGIPADAVYNWLRLGQVPASTRAGRWCILWDPQTQEIYRQKVAGSFRLKPKPSVECDGWPRCLWPGPTHQARDAVH
ncbi:helix-turn-helix domain-containing protein [Micromonospora sp. NPDC050686]|uniref:helix-turn-helix domain-containing protein n=1 Tax=Micromonospora sp. NPDC050686 TaxID=3154631 RepID=UPI0033DD89B1